MTSNAEIERTKRAWQNGFRFGILVGMVGTFLAAMFALLISAAMYMR